MIYKLRKKIFWIIQISLSVIILGVIFLFTVFSYRNTISSSTIFMDRIEGRMDIKNNKPEEFSENKSNETIEGIYKLRINNNKITSDFNNITDEIKRYAIEASDKNSDEGYIGIYIYKIRKFGNNEKEITLIESKDTILMLKTTIAVSIIIGILGIGIIYVIAKKISTTIVQPVENAFEKQKQFISDASHELKTPLAVIRANADVLQDKTRRK